MSFMRSLVSGFLVSVLLAPSAFAATTVAKQVVEGTYENSADLEMACRILIGIEQDVERDNTLLFQVRRCMSNYYKKQKNTRRGVARSARRQRVHMQLFKRSQDYKDRQNARQRRLTAAKIGRRSAQVTRSARDNRRIFSRTRSSRRSSIRAKERSAWSNIEAMRAAKRSARLYCSNYIGSTRAECVQKRMAELLEF